MVVNDGHLVLGRAHPEGAGRVVVGGVEVEEVLAQRSFVARGLGVGEEQLAGHALGQHLGDLEGDLRPAHDPVEVVLIGEEAVLDERLRTGVAVLGVRDAARLAVADLDVEAAQARHVEELAEEEGELDVVHDQSRLGSELERRADGDEIGRRLLAGVERDQAGDVVEQVLADTGQIQQGVHAQLAQTLG